MKISISEATRLWEKSLKKIEDKINDTKTFDTFFSDSYIYDISGNEISIITVGKLAKAVIEKQYLDLIRDVINELTEEEYQIRVYSQDEISDNAKSVQESFTEPKKVSSSTYFKDASLNPNLTFDNFVVGDFNKEAYQAALYVAQHGGTLFNPLFIYSHSGLGKTHLLHAIGNEILKTRMPNAKILYITANDFVEEYIKFVTAEKDNQSIKDFFKDVDVLLFDDVQFLADKVKTEEMFFYVYQDMINKGKRIIITNDRQPSELKGLEERLVTRFSQGLTVKIGEPDKETCIDILKEKITQNGLDVNKIDYSVLCFFAEKFSKNVRELEGALNNLILYSLRMKNTDIITMDVAIEAIGSLKGGKNVANQLSEEKIINTVCDYYNVTPTQVKGKIRTGQIALARHIAMYLIRNNLDVPLKKIGETFGGKDHTTVMSALSKVDKELKTNEQLKKAIEDLSKKIKE